MELLRWRWIAPSEELGRSKAEIKTSSSAGGKLAVADELDGCVSARAGAREEPERLRLFERARVPTSLSARQPWAWKARRRSNRPVRRLKVVAAGELGDGAADVWVAGSGSATME